MKLLIFLLSFIPFVLSAENGGPQQNLNFMRNGDVFIYGSFDDTLALDVIPTLSNALQVLKGYKGKQQLYLRFYINSGGGQTNYLFNLLALVEEAKKQNIIVETYVFGDAYSAASVLAASGTKGHRFCSRYSEHLVHLGMVVPGEIKTDRQLERFQKEIKLHFDTIRSLYRKYAKIPSLDALISDDDYFISGADIISDGLADAFVD